MSDHTPHASTPVPHLPSRLLHPLWWTALALMITNDHLLKGSTLVAPEIAGKLSDFTGMIVAPALLAILLRVRTRRGLRHVHLLVGAILRAEALPVANTACEDAPADLTDGLSIHSMFVELHPMSTK